MKQAEILKKHRERHRRNLKRSKSLVHRKHARTRCLEARAAKELRDEDLKWGLEAEKAEGFGDYSTGREGN